MRFNQIIELVSVRIRDDEIGNQIEDKQLRKVYANQRNISMSEFYNASISDIKPSAAFEIYTFEYEGEKELFHNGKHYEVVRVSTLGDRTILTCEVNVSHA